MSSISKWLMARTACMLACLALHSAYAGDDGGALDRLTLKDAEAMMVRHNQEILAAQRQLEVAQADQIIAAQRPNPTVGFDATSISPSQGIGSGSLLRDKFIEKTIHMEQLIERGGKRDLRIEQASYNEQASRTELANTVREQQLALRGAYFDLLLAQEKVAILRDIAEMSVRSREAAERRLQAGDVSKIEAARIRVEGLRAAGEAEQAEAELARARVALAVLIGAESSAASIRAVDPWPERISQEAVPDLDKAIALRPDVRAAQTRLLASDTGRRLAQSSRVRDVTVGAQYTHFPFNREFGTGSGNTFGFTVSMPIFLWHANEGEIRRAEAEHLAAEAALNKTRVVARAELTRAWSDLVQAAARVARFQGPLLQDARAAAEGVEFAYKQGAVGVADLLDARRVYRATQIDAAQARNDYAKALAAWRLAIASEPAAGSMPSP